VTTPEEREVVADEKAAEAIDADNSVEAEAEPAKVEYIEFVGTDAKYGTEFHSEHTVTRAQIRDAWDIKTPKDLTWTKLEGGPHKGRMLVPVSDMSPEAAAGLENDPMFRRVTL
jgi:hypothetical protein